MHKTFIALAVVALTVMSSCGKEDPSDPSTFRSEEKVNGIKDPEIIGMWEKYEDSIRERLIITVYKQVAYKDTTYPYHKKELNKLTGDSIIDSSRFVIVTKYMEKTAKEIAKDLNTKEVAIRKTNELVKQEADSVKAWIAEATNRRVDYKFKTPTLKAMNSLFQNTITPNLNSWRTMMYEKNWDTHQTIDSIYWQKIVRNQFGAEFDAWQTKVRGRK